MQAPDIDSDLFVEVLGILVNLDIPSYDWPAFIAKHDLLTLLAGMFILAVLMQIRILGLWSASCLIPILCNGLSE